MEDWHQVSAVGESHHQLDTPSSDNVLHRDLIISCIVWWTSLLVNCTIFLADGVWTILGVIVTHWYSQYWLIRRMKWSANYIILYVDRSDRL